jgi:hypothetical protein
MLPSSLESQSIFISSSIQLFQKGFNLKQPHLSSKCSFYLKIIESTLHPRSVPLYIPHFESIQKYNLNNQKRYQREDNQEEELENEKSKNKISRFDDNFEMEKSMVSKKYEEIKENDKLEKIDLEISYMSTEINNILNTSGNDKEPKKVIQRTEQIIIQKENKIFFDLEEEEENVSEIENKNVESDFIENEEVEDENVSDIESIVSDEPDN